MANDIRPRDFNDLPPEVQQRLQADVQAHVQGRPSAVVFAIGGRAGDDAARNRSVLMALGALGLAAWMLAAGFGEGLLPAGAAAMLVALLAAAVFAWLKAFDWHRRGAVRLPPAAYVFPGNVVDTRDGRFVVHPLDGLKQLSCVDVQNAGRHLYTRLDLTRDDGRSVQLAVGPRELAQRCAAALQQRHQQLATARRAGATAVVAAMDPFAALRGADAGGGASASSLLRRLKRSALAWALGLALPLGMAAWGLRNLASDQVFFDRARAAGTEAALLDYVAKGWRHVEPARAALPRAALGDARKAGSVTALRGVLRRYPEAGLQAEVQREVHAVFEQAFERFKAMATRSDRGVEPFVRELLARLETSGDSGVDVHFVRPGTEGLAAVDRRKTGLAPVAAHFGSQGADAREQRMVAELAKGFRLVFPQDVLALTRATGAQRPQLRVSYDIAPSGMTYRSELTGHSFVGVVVKFDVAFTIPGSSAVWRSRLQVLPPDRFSVNGRFPSDGQVYGEMADRAFDRLSGELHRVFFAPSSV